MLLQALGKAEVTMEVLIETGLGKRVKKLGKGKDEAVSKAAAEVVAIWKKVVAATASGDKKDKKDKACRVSPGLRQQRAPHRSKQSFPVGSPPAPSFPTRRSNTHKPRRLGAEERRRAACSQRACA